MPLRRIIAPITLLIAVAALCRLTAQTASKPETVMVRFEAKPGSEADLERVIARHWTAITKLKLVVPNFHVSLRGTDDDHKTYFIELFTWRDPSIPDTAPTEITTLWNEMNRLVDPVPANQAWPLKW